MIYTTATTLQRRALPAPMVGRAGRGFLPASPRILSNWLSSPLETASPAGALDCIRASRHPIRHLGVQAGYLSQADVVRATGISRSSVSRIIANGGDYEGA